MVFNIWIILFRRWKTKIKKYNYSTGSLEFEGEIINGTIKKGKEYKDDELLFEGEYFLKKK